MNKIIIYEDEFYKFKNHAHDFIKSLPAKPNDKFAIASAKTKNGAVGFHDSEELAQALQLMLKKAPSLKLNNKLIRYDFFSGTINMKKKNEAIEGEINDFIKNSIKKKKNEILVRQGKEKQKTPKPTKLDCVLDGESLDEEAYNFLIDNCEYILFIYPSTEHGSPTIYIASRSIQSFYIDLISCTDNISVEKVTSFSEIPCY